jgi:SWI/SNF-related matrix-associated actin-dependent regulator of chromatin subfamily A3
MHFPSQVVGVRFYTGIVHRNEMVMLVREPQNPYDPNAIRVDNLSGIMVGYVNSKSGDAGLLSPLMDSGKVRLEANGDVKGPFTMPLSITVWALPEDIEWVLQSLPERVTAASSWGNGGGGVA